MIFRKSVSIKELVSSKDDASEKYKIYQETSNKYCSLSPLSSPGKEYVEFQIAACISRSNWEKAERNYDKLWMRYRKENGL